MKSKRLLSSFLVLLCASILWGCSGKNYINIKQEQHYYIHTLVPYTLGDENIRMHNDDNSFLEFGKEFRSMRIVFVTDKDSQLDFIVTSCTQRNGNIKGSASRILPDGPDKGKLIQYSFWSDREIIYLQSLDKYRVEAPVKNEDGTFTHQIATVERNKVVAQFYRTTPGWIGKGGGA